MVSFFLYFGMWRGCRQRVFCVSFCIACFCDVWYNRNAEQQKRKSGRRICAFCCFPYLEKQPTAETVYSAQKMPLIYKRIVFVKRRPIL